MIKEKGEGEVENGGKDTRDRGGGSEEEKIVVRGRREDKPWR